MSNKRYDNINIPLDIDEAIEKGVSRALKEKNKNHKRNNLPKIAAASLVGILTLGALNPALASKIPFVGNVFEAIEKNIYFPGNYSQYSTAINETAYSNGIGVTLSEVVCDGQSLYITYVVENEKPFKYTSWGNGKKLDMNQLIIEEAYNKVSFSDKELDSTGFAGLEGKFTDEYTFVGVQKYKINEIKEEVPDEFTFKTKLKVIDNYAINEGDKDDVTWGTWAFNIPVKVNKELRNIINLENVENDFVKVNSISITPFDMIIKNSYKKGTWDEYRMTVFDDKGKKLEQSESTADNDNKGDKTYLQSPKDSKNIRVVIEKPKYKELKSQPGTYEEIGSDVVLDEVINLKK